MGLRFLLIAIKSYFFTILNCVGHFALAASESRIYDVFGLTHMRADTKMKTERDEYEGNQNQRIRRKTNQGAE